MGDPERRGVRVWDAEVPDDLLLSQWEIPEHYDTPAHRFLWALLADAVRCAIGAMPVRVRGETAADRQAEALAWFQSAGPLERQGVGWEYVAQHLGIDPVRFGKKLVAFVALHPVTRLRVKLRAGKRRTIGGRGRA